MDSNMEFHCDLKGLCVSCVTSLPPFQCCYQEFLLTKRECNFGRCFFTKYCPHANINSFREKQKAVLNLLKYDRKAIFKNPATSLPANFVPEVMPMKKECEQALAILKEVETPIIAVSLQNFFDGVRETSLLTRARRDGLNKFFDYSGQILLTTDVKDRLCDKFVENVNYFRALIESLKPDYLTTFDTYTYSNIPACISRIKMQQALASSRKLVDLDCKTIGLSLGATPDQVLEYVKELKKMGSRIVAFPVYEFRKKNDTFSIRWRIFLARKLKLKTLLLSCSPGSSAQRKVYADYYSSYSWFASTNSRKQNAFERRKKRVIRMIDLGVKHSKQRSLLGDQKWE